MLRSRLPELALLVVVTMWASTFVLTKRAFEEMSPLAFTFVRFGGIALLALLVLAVSVQSGRAQWSVLARDLPRFALVGVCGYTLYQLGFVLGLARTSPFSSSLLIGTVPLFTIALLTVAGERPPARVWIGVLVALAGAVIFLLDKFGAPGTLVGDLLSLSSALSFAAYGVLNRPLVKRYPTATYTAYSIVCGAVPLLLVSVPAAVAQDWTRVSAAGWLVIAYMIVLPVYVAYMVWNWAIARRGAAAASSYSLLTPLISGVLSVALIGEAFTVVKVVGAALVLVGLVLLQRPPARAAAS